MAQEPTPPAGDAVKRTITVLAAEMPGASTLVANLDPEDVRDVLDPAVELMIRCVEAGGGIVKDLAGTGMLALFGTEGDGEGAAAAVTAGLRIVAEFGDYARRVAAEWDVDAPAVRIGIETGEAAIGMVGAGARVELGATGDVVNTAARLQAGAEAGTILVGPRCHAVVAGAFTWGEARALQLKGKAEPVAARPVLAAGTGAA